MALEARDFEKFSCYQCHDSGDPNCTARCKGSQEAMRGKKEERRHIREIGYDLMKTELEQQEEIGGNTPPSKEAIEFVSRLKRALQKRKE